MKRNKTKIRIIPHNLEAFAYGLNTLATKYGQLSFTIGANGWAVSSKKSVLGEGDTPVEALQEAMASVWAAD